MENTDYKRRKKPRFKDNTKVLFIRWWVAGAIYFFLAFGSTLGANLSGLDLTFMLSVATGFITILFFNPAMFGFFDITKNGVIINDLRRHRTIFQGVVLKLIEFVKCTASVVLVSLTYYYINILLVKSTGAPTGSIILKGEPILYATMYTIYYQLISLIPAPYDPKKVKAENIELDMSVK
ncbi:MAG: hypothetical protein ACRQFF_01600 [Sphaerochaeta sp.]